MQEKMRFAKLRPPKKKKSEVVKVLMLSSDTELFLCLSLCDLKQTHHEWLCPLPLISPWITVIFRYLLYLLRT